MNNKNQIKKEKKLGKPIIPTFFRYFRINEINVNITYWQGENSFMNTWNLKIKIPAFIRNWKFETFDEMRH